ncbi:MAG TPA: dihydropteroate synthase, partial [Solirubrobacteraceae bacterium]|nr:dihydropteroate synthase [Solirubrobacteraceae bacterium]
MGAYRLMGIVNVTPDSFSDGGLFLDSGAAIAHGLELAEQGAHILDIGGESTRPGAEPVEEREELRRVAPVIEGLADAVKSMPAHPQISVDTSKAAVAEVALRAGASLVNDVSALRADPEMAGVVAESGAECCLMHMLASPRTMQRDPRYGDVVDDVKAFLQERLAFAVGEGIDERRILLDPGIGFGKTV